MGKPPPFPVNAAAEAKLLRLLSAKGVSIRPCPICGRLDWKLGYFITLPANPRPNMFQDPYSRSNYPFVTLSCQVCGNTHLLNLINLGLTVEDLQSLSFPAE